MRVRWLTGGALVSSGLDETLRVWSLSAAGEATSLAVIANEESMRGLGVSSSLGLIASSGRKTKSVTLWQPKG